MKSFIYFIFFLNSLILINTVVPNWNLKKIGKRQRSGDKYTHTLDVYEKNWRKVHLILKRTFTFKDGKVDKKNLLHMSGEAVVGQEREVDFDNVDNFYYLNGNYYVCPKGAHHLYDYTGKKYVIPNGFPDGNAYMDFDFKCVYHIKTSVFLVFYLFNGEYNVYGIYVGGGTPIDNMKRIYRIGDELYDYKIVNDNKYYDEYLMMALYKAGNDLVINTIQASLNDQQEQKMHEAGNAYNCISAQKCTLASFRSEEHEYKNDFFYVTYNDLSNFYSGYSIKAPEKYNDNMKDVVKAQNNDTAAHLEFFEDLEIKEINFMFSNRFLYYILKQKNTDTSMYYGIFDTKLNKVVFNTNENIVYYYPYSDTEMLAVTQDEAYIICAFQYDSNGKCVDYCDGDNYYIDTQGNKCDSPVCSPGNVTLVPSGVCNETCDTTYYVEKDGLCGLCKFLYPDKKFKLVGGTDCISDVDNKWKKVNEKLGLYECSEGFILKGNECVENITCPENCSKCNEDLACTECKKGFLLENSKCNENCSEGRGVIDTPGKCDICPDNACEIFVQNECNCEKCSSEHYFVDSDKKCSICDDNCKSCEGEAKKCKSCPVNYKLFNNKCYKCQEQNCKVKENDDCRCNTCKDGYYVDDYECKRCNETCKTCSSESVCSECQEGYYIQDNECNSCNNSISNCKKCNNSTVCEQCAEHFYKNLSGQCRACPSVCEKTKSDKCQCETCINGYYMDNNENCQKCSDKCQTCEGSPNKCTSCKNAHQFVDNEGICQDCDRNCQTCSIKRDNCTSCKSNEYLDKGNNTCNLCSEICKTCSSGELNGEHNCLSCNNNRYLILDDYNKTCVDNCTEYGREFYNNSYYVCKPLRKTNNTGNDGGEKGNSDSIDYLLWIFVSVIGVLLLIITICICKKCCYNKYDSEVIEEITTELDEKEIIN